MRPGHRIAPAAPDDVAVLAAVEIAAAAMLRGHAPASVLAETTCLGPGSVVGLCDRVVPNEPK